MVIESITLCDPPHEGAGILSGGSGGDGRPRIETDSYALIPAHARFVDLLQIVLLKTGHVEEMSCARGRLG